MSLQSRSKTCKSEPMGPQVNPEAPKISPKSTSGSKKHRKSQKHITKSILSASAISLTSIDHQSINQIKSNHLIQLAPFPVLSEHSASENAYSQMEPLCSQHPPISQLSPVRVKGPAAWAKPLDPPPPVGGAERDANFYTQCCLLQLQCMLFCLL